jgi:hypothetical protein
MVIDPVAAVQLGSLPYKLVPQALPALIPLLQLHSLNNHPEFLQLSYAILYLLLYNHPQDKGQMFRHQN